MVPVSISSHFTNSDSIHLPEGILNRRSRGLIIRHHRPISCGKKGFKTKSAIPDGLVRKKPQYATRNHQRQG
jgi:hypothetical protein